MKVTSSIVEGKMYITTDDKTADIFESLLAEVVDDLYLEHKPNFCDYKNKTHKLGWFKEKIKMEISERILKWYK